ncbi:MAG TPA: histidine kinase [Roseiflexaceae bacterium]|nr:histidine kinase [Roseiflexaceae bacterium]
MSGIRPNQRPWLADHVIFLCYRWLSWATAALPLFWLDLPVAYGWALLVTGLLNIPATLFAQGYIRVSRRTPAVMALDIFYMVLMLHLLRLAAGEAGQLYVIVFYAYSSLILPGLLFGWRGGLMAGLAFVTMDRAADMTVREWGSLALIMLAPPIFGVIVPLLVDVIRQLAARRSGRQQRQQTRALGAGPRREPPRSSLGFAALDRDGEAGHQDERAPAPLALQATSVRAVEPGVEDLRRVLFAPFPAPNMELVEALETLTLRFSQQSGAASYVVKLGRVRRMHPAHRSVLIRLVQEALLNVQQHAHAASAVCTVRYDASSVVLLLQDDGVGLLDGTHERPGLHALRAMHYRLAELGGRLDVFETEGGGVTVRATMPLE